MIENERQYIITKAQARKFREALSQFDERRTAVEPALLKAQKDAMKSQLDELETQVKEYERLKTSNYEIRKDPSIRNLPVELSRPASQSG